MITNNFYFLLHFINILIFLSSALFAFRFIMKGIDNEDHKIGSKGLKLLYLNLLMAITIYIVNNELLIFVIFFTLFIYILNE